MGEVPEKKLNFSRMVRRAAKHASKAGKEEKAGKNSASSLAAKGAGAVIPGGDTLSSAAKMKGKVTGKNSKAGKEEKASAKGGKEEKLPAKKGGAFSNMLSARKENPFVDGKSDGKDKAGGKEGSAAVNKATKAGSKAGDIAGSAAGAYFGGSFGAKIGSKIGAKLGGNKFFLVGFLANVAVILAIGLFILMLPALVVATALEKAEKLGPVGDAAISVSCAAGGLVPSPAKEILQVGCEEFNTIADAIGTEELQALVREGYTDEFRGSVDCTSLSPKSRQPMTKKNGYKGNCVEGLVSPEAAYWSPVPKKMEWMVPIWEKAANRYDLDWKVLAAISATRTYYGSRNCSTSAKGSGGGEGFYRTPSGMSRANGVNAGTTKISTSIINCKRSREPAKTFPSMDKSLKKSEVQKEKASRSADAYDAVDATFTTAKILARYGAYGKSKWDYSGDEAGTCTVPGSDGRINYAPAAAASSSGGMMGYNKKLKIPRWAGALAAKYTYKKGDAKTKRYKPRRDTPDPNRLPMPKKDLVRLLTVAWQAFGKKGGELRAAVEANYKQIGRESGGRPYILQGYIGDVNDNNPAGGLMQFIPGTFDTWKVSGFNNRFNPLDNILAAVNAQVNASSIAGAGPGNILDGRSGWSPVMGPRGNPYAKGGKVERVNAVADPNKSEEYKGKEAKDPVSNAVRTHGGDASDCYVAVVHEWYKAIKEKPPAKSTVSGGAMRARILEVARAELAKTPRENGGDNMPKYNGGAGEQAPYHINGGPWCAAFATWVWREAGVKIESSAYSGYPIEWGGKKGLVKKDNPEPGDFVIYDAAQDGAFTDHIGIVEKVKNGKMITTIEGNYADGVVRRTSFSNVYRYVSPAGDPTEGPGSGGKDTSQGAFVPCPKKIPQDKGNPCYIDNRIIADLLWIHKKYGIYITDGYSGPLPRSKAAGCYASGSQCHTLAGEHPLGLGVDIVPAPGKSWDSIDKLAKWAEPSQNNPRKPFRYVGYNGDKAHGRGHHLHLSWDHSVPTKPYKPAKWVLTMKGGKKGLDSSQGNSNNVSGNVSGAKKPKIKINHIPYGSDRKKQMAAYSKRRYGQASWKLKNPKQIVIHFTAMGTLQSNINYFASNSAIKGESPGVCAHYFVDKDGSIVEVVPTNIRCRHVIGLNHVSVGIEFVESSASGVLGNKKQLKAGRKLVAWLQGRHNIKKNNVIGHAEANSSRYYKDKTGQKNDHGDWNSAEMKKFKKGL
jgi:hypothetical protein